MDDPKQTLEDTLNLELKDFELTTKNIVPIILTLIDKTDEFTTLNIAEKNQLILDTIKSYLSKEPVKYAYLYKTSYTTLPFIIDYFASNRIIT